MVGGGLAVVVGDPPDAGLVVFAAGLHGDHRLGYVRVAGVPVRFPQLVVALRDVIDNSVARTKQVGDLASISAWLGSGQFVPSEKAAMTVWRVAFSTQRKKS